MALSASVDLYVPIVLSAVLGLLPAFLVLPRGPSGSERTGPARGGENPALRPSPSR
jgi:hypothetical protein